MGNLDQGTQYIPPLKAIRKNCLECVGGSSEEVKNCTSPKCPLFHYRFGKNPFTKKREYTEEQKAEMAERLKKARGNK